MKFLGVVALAACASQVSAKPEFVKLVPGATNVPGVAAIGHVNKVGGGDGNAFGIDFYKAETKWTVDLCYKDSDGDEQFNGAELGDPCCEWVKGTNEKLSYTTATAPGDKTSKQDPTIWASVKCANGQDPVTKYKAYLASATTTTGSTSGTTPAPSVGESTTDNSTAPATSAVPTPTTTAPTPAKTSGAAQTAVAASAVVVAAAALFM